jgi:hypothetical protein
LTFYLAKSGGAQRACELVMQFRVRRCPEFFFYSGNSVRRDEEDEKEERSKLTQNLESLTWQVGN